jgi:chromatin structure-remodeling complex subunit SFH1
VTPQYRLKDTFIWNLHEALTTPDQFARQLTEELDLPYEKRQALILEITTQIRQQMEEYAGVALHPLFQPSNPAAATPAPRSALTGVSRAASSTPVPHTNGVSRNGSSAPTPIPAPSTSAPGVAPNAAPASALNEDDLNSPDDAYRCVINLNINLKNQLYSDKFEWSLVHPPGMAEMFAFQTCADLGLDGEWVSAITHGIYEAVLKQKKEACENGGVLAAPGGTEIDNDALDGQIAGWRYEPEHGGDEWGPRVEALSKEEIEKREGDRERQIRRVRRETARFSSTTNMIMGTPQSDYFAIPDADTPMGRGMRDRKRRRFRSNSPQGRDTPDAGYGGEGGGLKDWYVLHGRLLFS